jgi:hypothetical protein
MVHQQPISCITHLFKPAAISSNVRVMDTGLGAVGAAKGCLMIC